MGCEAGADPRGEDGVASHPPEVQGNADNTAPKNDSFHCQSKLLLDKTGRVLQAKVNYIGDNIILLLTIAIGTYTITHSYNIIGS